MFRKPSTEKAGNDEKTPPLLWLAPQTTTAVQQLPDSPPEIRRGLALAQDELLSRQFEGAMRIAPPAVDNILAPSTAPLGDIQSSASAQPTGCINRRKRKDGETRSAAQVVRFSLPPLILEGAVTTTESQTTESEEERVCSIAPKRMRMDEI